MELLTLMLDQHPSHTFDSKFWPNYPRHDKKKDAQKAWLKLLPDTNTIDAILIALAWQRTLKAWRDPQFIPLAGTYLRGRYWKNEPPPHIARLVSVKPPPLDDAARRHVWLVQQEMAERASQQAKEMGDEYYRTHPWAKP